MSNDPRISHYLGIDYGQAKIGLSIADSETKMAFGYGTLENNKELFEKLAEIVQKEEIGKVVIGMPMLRNREDQGNEKIYKGFGEELQNIFPEIEIIFADEMFSTKIAQDNLKEKGMKNVKEFDHQEAARIILQGWLDQVI
jgi:putative Holliday junction resolvase